MPKAARRVSQAGNDTGWQRRTCSHCFWLGRAQLLARQREAVAHRGVLGEGPVDRRVLGTSVSPDCRHRGAPAKLTPACGTAGDETGLATRRASGDVDCSRGDRSAFGCLDGKQPRPVLAPALLLRVFNEAGVDVARDVVPREAGVLPLGDAPL